MGSQSNAKYGSSMVEELPKDQVVQRLILYKKLVISLLNINEVKLVLILSDLHHWHFLVCSHLPWHA